MSHIVLANYMGPSLYFSIAFKPVKLSTLVYMVLYAYTSKTLKANYMFHIFHSCFKINSTGFVQTHALSIQRVHIKCKIQN